jgi:6-phosphogluconate dehydrogenase
MSQATCDIGLVGLGVMGRNFLLNLADHGFSVVGLDRDEAKVARLADERGSKHDVTGTVDIAEFVSALKRPRAVMLLVPAGAPVDAVLEELVPRLDAGDIVLDGGNSHFRDTQRRLERLAEGGVHFAGTGVSGGAEGARHGPCLMPGGPREAYERVEPILTRAAAHVDGEPCVAHLGAGAAGHYVKMVHNGIEYGIMQLIAEAYDLLRRVLAREAGEIAEIFARWRDGPLNSFLVELTADVLTVRDPESGRPLVDLVRDTAQQKGTGRWTSVEALDLQVPTPTIDAAVTARHLSSLAEQRQHAADTLERPELLAEDDPEQLIARIGDALFAAVIVTYAQGFALLHRASAVYEFGVDLGTVARIWRGGCIIRAAVLDDIREALASKADRPNLLLDRGFARLVNSRVDELRKVVAIAVTAGVPAPALSASLAYYDGLRSSHLPANLIQAQRDAFGSHGYERADREGTFHSDWKPQTGGEG